MGCAKTQVDLGTKDAFNCDEAITYVIEKHPEMQTILINNSFEITDKGLQAVLSSQDMEKVEINSSKITGTGLNPGVNYLKNIRFLTLKTRGLLDQGLVKILQHCGTKLKTLGIPQSNVTGEGFSVLFGKFINLETLDLGYCKRITKQGMNEILMICGSKLKVLDLFGTMISGENLSSVREKLINLETLILGGCKCITQRGMLEFLQVCGTHLKDLDLSQTNVTGEGLSVLQGKLIKLETLYLRGCRGLTKMGLMELLQMCGTELKDLDLSATCISCEGLSVLQNKLVNLETLNLGYCEGITDQGIMELLELCGPGLRSLTLGNSHDGIPRSIQRVAEKAQLTRPKLTISGPI